jgi:hypothetical protein
VDGITPRKPTDPEKEAAFVFGTGEGRGPVTPPTPEPAVTGEPFRLPLTTRLRADLVRGLKRAALERQLNGVEPHTVQEMLEAALEPWLRQNGLLK